MRARPGGEAAQLPRRPSDVLVTGRASLREMTGFRGARGGVRVFGSRSRRLAAYGPLSDCASFARNRETKPLAAQSKSRIA